jgi:hypothetical protein
MRKEIRRGQSRQEAGADGNLENLSRGEPGASAAGVRSGRRRSRLAAAMSASHKS